MHWQKVLRAMPTIPHLQWLFLIYVTIGLTECISTKKKSCVVKKGHADCSHMSLREIPQNLPQNISSLDISHNRLVQLSHEWLRPYPELDQLDAGFNSISKLDEKMCQTVPLLRILNIEKNEMLDPKTEELSPCTNLEWLSMASNRLKLKQEPFAGLQKLKYLDISNNNLKTAALSKKPQLPSLIYLGLGYNNINILKNGDFNFLKLSSLLVLNLSSVPLKTVEPGSFKNVASLRTLVLDGSKIGIQVLSKISIELSGSDIEALSLKKMKLSSLINNTFTGLTKTNLRSIDLSGNGLVKIDIGSFSGLHKLQSLDLADNKIQRLKKDTFEGLQNLKMLNMTNAFVDSTPKSQSRIENFAFQNLCALETLILHGSSIGEIADHTFTGLTNLKDLDLSWQKNARPITNLTLASLMDSPLRTLNLGGTALKTFHPGAFSFLTNLTQLHLEFNFINQIITGDEFKGLGQLEEMYLFSNQKITLISTSFLHVSNLKILMLAKSLTGTTLDMEPSPFKPLSKLTILDLSNNNMANIRETLLEGLINLKVLYLQHNNLARLWKSANVGGPVMFLKGAPNLVTLQMDSNGFDEIPANGLKGLFNLTQLSLSNNLLNSMKESIFDDLSSLQVFKLQKNLITAVRPQVFRTPMTSNLKILVMDKNPFDCTCESILWFITWLNITNATVPDLGHEYICNTPLSFFNKSILKFDTLSCKDMTPFQTLYILSSTTVLLLMITALLVRFQGWKVQFYCNILISRTLGLSDAKAEEGRSFDFDAYVIHAEEDASWVEKRMLPLERDQCRFCLEDRDSIPGMSLLQSIVDNMRRSRKILFVVTDNLLNDRWCRRFTAHHALHQVIEDSRDSVVLVLLEDIHDYKLSQALFLRRGMLRPCCVVHWPVQRERIPAFHQKLFIALGKTNQWLQ